MSALAIVEDIEIDPTELPSGAVSETYSFDENFQLKVVALAIRDTSFMQRTEGLIRPEYFEAACDASLIHIASRYFEKYRKAPGDSKIVSMLIRQDAINKVIRREDIAAVAKRIKDIPEDDLKAGGVPGLYQADISDREYIIDNVATFARHQAVSKAILDSVGHLDLNEFDKISTSLKKALDVGENQDNRSYSYGEMVEARTEERLERIAGRGPMTGVTTGYPELDKLLYHKGWGKRELSCLMGAAKSGKSTAMLDFGISACTSAHRFNVLYVTLEVSEKVIADRLDSRLSEIAMVDLDKNIHTVGSKVKEIMAKSGKFDIVEFPTGSMRVSDLRRLLETKKARGIKYDLVVVDYADLMQPERFTDNAIENSKNVYVGLRGLAMQEDIAVLTATQTNREGSKKMVATMTDVSDDFNKVRICDILITINKTDEEKKIQQCRLYFAAVRNGPSNFSVRLQQDIDRMRFCKEVLGED